MICDLRSVQINFKEYTTNLMDPITQKKVLFSLILFNEIVQPIDTRIKWMVFIFIDICNLSIPAIRDEPWSRFVNLASTNLKDGDTTWESLYDSNYVGKLSKVDRDDQMRLPADNNFRWKYSHRNSNPCP